MYVGMVYEAYSSNLIFNFDEQTVFTIISFFERLHFRLFNLILFAVLERQPVISTERI